MSHELYCVSMLVVFVVVTYLYVRHYTTLNK